MLQLTDSAATDDLSVKFSQWFKLIKRGQASYLVSVSSHNLNIAFFAIQFQTMPMALLAGRNSQTPMTSCLFICGVPIPEKFPHTLSLILSSIHSSQNQIAYCVFNGLNFFQSEKLLFHLSDFDSFISYGIPLLALAAKKT